MGREPVTQDWELIVGRDLAASLIPRGQLRRLQRPVEFAMLPDGAYRALAGRVGRHGLGDSLLVPAAIRPVPSWRRRCRFTAMCVLGIGESGLGLWADALPSPDVRVVLPFDAVAAIERRDEGSRRRLTVTGNGGGFSVCYDADGDASADIWTRRLRLRCAGCAAPLPEEPRATARPPDLWSFLIQPGDEAVAVRWRSLLCRRSCLLAVTAREIIVVNSGHALIRPWRRDARALYVPRAAVTDAVITPQGFRPGRFRQGILLLRSAGSDVRVRFPSWRLAAAASRWLARSQAEALIERRAPGA